MRICALFICIRKTRDFYIQPSYTLYIKEISLYDKKLEKFNLYIKQSCMRFMHIYFLYVEKYM